MTESFQRRGSDSTRIEAFVDAAFAFSLTLLVISFDEIPGTFPELIVALKGIPAFLASFAIITMFWAGHRNWSNRYGMDTTFSTLVSLALVFVIMVYVYPLRTMLAAVFNMISNGWIPGSFTLSSALEVRGLFTIYGIGFILASLTLVILNVHAYRHRIELQLNELEIYNTVTEYYAWAALCLTGLCSILIAWAAAEKWLGLAGWTYSALMIVMPALSILRDRKAPCATS